MKPARVVLLPRTREKPSQLAVALLSLGADVRELRATGPADYTPDIVLIPAANAVGVALRVLADLPYRPIVLAMGPRSAAAAKAAGWEPDAIAVEPTLEAFTTLVGEYLTK